MTIDISDNDPRINYTVASGVTQTSFAVPFEFFADSDLNVYVDGVLQTITTDYTVSGGDGSTGTITMSITGGAGGTAIAITRDITIERITDFPTGVDINRSALNTQLDTLTAISADLKDKIDRSLQLTDYDLDANLTLPDVDDRKGKTLAFNASTGAVEAGPSISDVQTVSAAAADIATLADIEDGTDATDAIQTVAGISANVTTVAGISSNVTTVAGISSNVTTVAGISSDVTAVASDATDIGTVATNIANVNTAATNIADINTAASNIADIQNASTNAATATTKATEAANSATAAATSASEAAASAASIAPDSLLTVANNLSDVASAATSRANLGVEIGVDVQAYDATILNSADIGVSVQAYDADTAKLDVAQTFTAAQRGSTDTDTTNTGSVTLDFSTNQNFVLTLTGNVTLANPTTEVVGQSGFIVFIQDATGGRTVSLGTDYETAGAAGLTLSSAASTTDIVPYVVAASGRILLGAPQLAFA